MDEIKKEVSKMQVTRDNIYAVLAYLWVLCLIPVLMKKDDPFVRFHARQGLMLFIIEVALGIVGIIPFLGVVIAQIGGLVCLVLSVLSIIQVLKGNQWKIPYVGDWAEKVINI
jgi:fumarate reductase subunit D